MHHYQVWIICAIVLVLSGLDSTQARSVDNNNRHTYIEDFSTLSNLDYLENTHLDIKNNQLTLQLDDHIVQQEPVVVGNPEDGAESVYVIWEDLRNDDGDIYAQKLDADGLRMWAEDKQVNDSPEETRQSKPAAIVDSAGDLWVVWVDDRRGDDDIYVQGLASEDGRRIWAQQGDQPVNEEGDGARQGSPAVAIHGNALIVAWHDDRDDSEFDIYAERFDLMNEGELERRYNSIQLNTEANGSQTDPSIAVDRRGNVIVTWLDQRIGNGDIYAQKILADSGQSLWVSERRINQPEHGAQKPPKLVMKSDGQAIVGWLSSVDASNQVYIREINDEENGADISITSGLLANSGVQPTATVIGDHIAIGWKQINDGNLHIDIRDLSVLQTSGAAGKIDGENQIGSRSSNNKMLSLGALNNSEIFAVWVDSRQGRKTDIYAQKLTLDGKSVWSQARFINKSMGQIDQQEPAVVVDNQGNSIVAWYSGRGGQDNLFLQKFDSEGQPLWNRPIPVNNADIQAESLIPDLAILNSDTLIAWSGGSDTGTSRIYVQRFDSHGNRLWHRDQLASKIEDPTINQSNPQIAVDTIGSNTSSVIFITWQENGTDSRIALQKLDSEGNPVLREDQYVPNPSGGILQFPTLSLTNEQIVMAWTSTTFPSTDLYLQTRNKVDGTAFNGPTQVNEFSGLVEQLNPPALAASPDGNTIVVWTDRRSSDIYARSYDSQTDSFSDAKKLNQTTGSSSPRPDIAHIPNTNDVGVVWQGPNRDPWFIYAQRLNTQGVSQWNVDSEDEVAVKVSGDDSREAWCPAIAVDGNNMSSIVWREERNMNQDIYFNRLDENGVRQIDEDVLVIDSEQFYRSEGLVRSNPVAEIDGQLHKALLTYRGTSNSGQIAFKFINGSEEVSIQPGEIYTFTPPATELRWQAHLTQTNVASLDQAQPIIDDVYIDYSYAMTVTQPGDAYESDDECNSAWPIQPDGIVQARTLHSNGTDVDWISFRAALNTDYILLATPEHDNGAKLQIDVYDSCPNLDDTLQATEIGTQNNPTYLFLSDLNSTEYYVKISSESTVTEAVAYDFSVRPASSSVHAIVIRGFHDDMALVQVDYSADRVNRTLEENRLTTEYLNYGTNPDIISELEEIAQQRTMTETTLIVYLVGQVDPTTGGFRFSAKQSWTSTDLDLWLTNLENSGRIRNATVVIEADNAGSLVETLSGPNRVIIASTGAGRRTEQTARGFLFSDAFWLAMGQGHSVQQSFTIGKQVVEEFGSPCLPDMNDCPQVPELIGRRNLAQLSGLGISEPLTVPSIENPFVSRNQTGTFTITTTILSMGQPTASVYAHIGTTLDADGELIELTLSPSSTEASKKYAGTFALESEDGFYRITIYAWYDDFALRPKIHEYYFESTYFPLITK